MDFKNMSLKSILPILLPGILFVGLLIWKLSPAPPTAPTAVLRQQDVGASTGPSEIPLNVGAPQEDAAIQQQLDRDRQEQKQTKDLKIKLEQTNLELEQEKALAQINKLKKENRGAFNEPAVEGQHNLPEIRVDYIGGDSVKKEAILSIGGTSYQVKEKSNPAADIQVVSISDSSVTLHFSAPEELTKTIDYKPE